MLGRGGELGLNATQRAKLTDVRPSRSPSGSSSFLLPRNPPAFGGFQTRDSVQVDGLWDVQNNFAMGNCAENTAAKLNITREDQDAHCVESYTRAAAAWSAGKFADEIEPVVIKGPKGETVISEDEEYKKIIHSKVPTLRPVFKKEGGTVTAANASTINDGASAVVLMTGEKVKELNVKPIAKIIGFADAAIAPIDFPVAPTVAIPLALKNAGLTIEDISLFEINEAFSVVVRAAEKVLSLDPNKVNVSRPILVFTPFRALKRLTWIIRLWHNLLRLTEEESPLDTYVSIFPLTSCPPVLAMLTSVCLPCRPQPIGSSGCRIVVTLIHLLQPGQYGVAAVCNGVSPSS